MEGGCRLRICTKHGIPYDTSTIEIESIDEAIVWIVDNQRGRRNVATKEQLDYISGKRRGAQKNIDKMRDEKGVFIPNAPPVDDLPMDDSARKSKKGQSLLKQANAEGCSHFKIQDNEKFAKGIDAIREVSPEMAEDHDKAERQYLPSWSSDRSLSSWDMRGLHCKMQAEAAHHALVAAILGEPPELLLSIERVRWCGDDPLFSAISQT